MPTAPTGLRDRKKAATRDRLLAETRDLLEAMGPSKFSTNEIASQAGVSHRTFFRYFPSKEAVLLDVCRITPLGVEGPEPDYNLVATCYRDLGDEWVGAMVARLSGGEMNLLTIAADATRLAIVHGDALDATPPDALDDWVPVRLPMSIVRSLANRGRGEGVRLGSDGMDTLTSAAWTAIRHQEGRS